MNNLAFEFNDGTIKWFSKEATIRGLRHNGERPIRMYVDDNVASQETIYGMTQINSQVGLENMTQSMYERTDKYLDHNDTLEQVWKNRVTNELVIRDADEFMVVYSPVLDGETISEEVARNRYPEYFI